MDLKNLISEATIILSLEATSKEECIRSLTSTLVDNGVVSNAEVYVESVLKREETGSTGIGFSVAIPHGKSPGVTEPGLAFARLQNALDWESLDGNPVSLVFLIAVPEDKAGSEHLQILASISRKLIHEEFRNKLLYAQSSQDILDAISN